MGVGGYFESDISNDTKYIELLRIGVESGMTFLDTAEIYGNGHSEDVVGKVLKGMRDKIFIATKVSPENLSYVDVLRSAENSLRRLQTDYIDLYQIHWPNPGISIDGTMSAMEKLVRDGKIRYIGISNFSVNELIAAEAALTENRIVSVQVEYNLFDRSAEEDILPYCESRGITVIAYTPLDRGRIASGNNRIKRLETIAQKYVSTVSQIALNWLITHPSVVVIPKAASEAHIIENAASSDFEISKEDYSDIERTFAMEKSLVPVDRIRVAAGGELNRKAYQTIEDALENKLGYVPSPSDLASNIKDGEILKPVRLVPARDKSGKYDYDLIEGRIRYWAWVIAHDGKMPVPALIRELS